MNKTVYISLIIFVLTGVFADFIASDKPIICRDNKGLHFPVMYKSKSFSTDDKCRILLNPLIRYSKNTIDKANAGAVSPFGKQYLKAGQQRHFLGTDHLGRDVLAGIIHGTRVALQIGTISMLLALVFGLLMSLYPGYYGDKGFRTKRYTLVIILLAFFSLIYFIYYRSTLISVLDNSHFLLVAGGFVLVIFFLRFILSKIPFFNKKTPLPLDSFFTIIIKLFQSLPGTFVVLILISLFSKPSIGNIIIVIALLKWPVIARYVRAEILKIKQERFIEASRAIGLPDRIIIWRHILPHVLTAAIVALSFGFAGTVLLESTLSFLGIGLPVDHVSWGSILSEARSDFSAWWLAVFPGLAIFFTILIFNHIGNSISKRIN